MALLVSCGWFVKVCYITNEFLKILSLEVSSFEMETERENGGSKGRELGRSYKSKNM